MYLSHVHSEFLVEVNYPLTPKRRMTEWLEKWHICPSNSCFSGKLQNCIRQCEDPFLKPWHIPSLTFLLKTLEQSCGVCPHWFPKGLLPEGSNQGPFHAVHTFVLTYQFLSLTPYLHRVSLGSVVIANSNPSVRVIHSELSRFAILSMVLEAYWH